MPAGIPLALDPGRLAQLREAAANGDPQAMAIMQSMSGGGGGGPPPGMAPQGMPPMGGMPPQGMPPMGGPPPMSQADFSGYGNGPPASQAQQAAKAAALIQLLRRQQR
jgi:hypothetical protein